MRTIQIKRILAGTTILGSLAFAMPAQAACSDLEGLSITDGKITSAAIVAEGAFDPPAGSGPPPGVAASPFSDIPAFCRVRMTLTPSPDSDIRSEVWLPLDGWNGNYAGVGNGIWAGSISFAEMGRNVARNYATAATDTGHVGNGMTAEWAIGHPEKLVDFGHRAVHVTTVAAKQIVKAFYGRGPELSIWNSCSTGGRQGLMAAHRYPEDFDAISAMAPANPMTDLMTQSMWQGWQPQRFNVRITPVELGMVHGAAVKQCDLLDGVEDGLISRPQQCGFDPVVLQCKAGQDKNCLSEGQVSAIRAMYDGVRAEDGTSLLPGWPVGSELQMAALTMGAEPFPVAMSYFRDLVYGGRDGWDWRKTDYRTYTEDARSYGAGILNVAPDGLNPFFARGGKLLLSHGWSDGLIPATNTLRFYHALYSAIPQQAAETQLRLFMAPGMDHCSGGEGPSEFDTLGTITDWAKTDQAPNRLIATRPTQVAGFPGQPPAPPREPMERPLCAYPWVAQYDGEGDPQLASSFSCGLPDPQ
ncbi:hypothetical protein FHS61_001863 [Altererythrobacter atlanticus]|uniref:Tannase and feruloyl esterase n=1 Tax=Croceibacterium atlanticum TaxID=1267766 RepID=A0A0F7KQL5_9SPHN|nr:tannase/feruloyl esterase family alpha/beta hydrolase [Croceibacterium atlanticum]AKH41376.1 Tannase and feruloyl esterase [Croceibacterium atlanticum]MBB5732837.1 hypothetical protein [Croceibacterium atlanticum]